MASVPFDSDCRPLYLLSSVRRYQRKGLFVIRRRLIPVPMLCWITKGKARVTLHHTVYSVGEQELLFLPPGSMLQASALTQEIEYYVIVIQAIYMKKQRRGKLNAAQPDRSSPLRPATSAASGSLPFAKSARSSSNAAPEDGAARAAADLFPPGILSHRDVQEVQSRIELLYKEAHQRTSSSSMQLLDLRLQALLELLLRQSPAPAGHDPEPGILRCVAYMQQHYQEKIDRQTLANLAKLTPNAFCRSFKRMTGMAPTDYLNGIRIGKAKELLSKERSVKDVAGAVGYGSEYYFSRVFKEAVGYPPSLFIRREKLRVATASRFSYEQHLSSLGQEATAAVDLYKYPWLDEAEYERRLLSQLEQLRLVKPDLIITDYAHSPSYEALKQIAPTVRIEHHLDWRTAFDQIAAWVGREREAEQALAELAAAASEARERLLRSEVRCKATVLQVLAQRIRIQGIVHHPLNELLYQDLGLMPGDGVPLNKMREELPPEELPELGADSTEADAESSASSFSIGSTPSLEYVFVIKPSDQPQADQCWSQVRHARIGISPLEQQPGIRFIPNWLIMSWTPQGRRRIMEQVLHYYLS